MSTTTDPRDQLWNVIYEAWYDTSYQELLSEALISKWLKLDELTKILVALTSGSSALAGLALWKDPSFSWLWPTLGGISAFLAIITERLAVTQKLKSHTETMRTFSSLRIDFDTLRAKMRINAMFDASTIESEYLDLRKRFSEAYKNISSDVLDTKELKIAVQNQLNSQLN
ncbi:hypothetical protein [Leptothrix ochracea]|uniref:hypothetical protein n=1 Tax=Leptothrix ochracea TaxID=735331 RepID=UPI0034E20A73